LSRLSFAHCYRSIICKANPLTILIKLDYGIHYSSKTYTDILSYRRSMPRGVVAKSGIATGSRSLD